MEKLQTQSWGRTLFEMIQDRKYTINDGDTCYQDIVKKLTKSEDKTYFCFDSSNRCVCISYISPSESSGNVGKNDIVSILENIMKPNNSNRCLLILDGVKLTSAAKSDIFTYFPTYIFESFELSHLQFNITKSDIVPKHKILSDEKVEKIIKKYKMEKKEMPKILYEDPVARYLGMLPGQICKINRISENGGKVNFYRICTL